MLRWTVPAGTSVAGEPRQRRGRGFALAAGVLAAVVSLSGCGVLDWGSRLAPSTTPISPQSPTVTPGPTAPSQSPTASAAAVRQASGSFTLYQNLVSKKFTGTCTTAEQLVFAVADNSNEFYGTVDVTAITDVDGKSVFSLSAVFGADGEEVTRELSYVGEDPVKGTSATVKRSGNTYQITGVAQAVEDRYGKKARRLIPFTLKLTCEAAA